MRHKKNENDLTNEYVLWFLEQIAGEQKFEESVGHLRLKLFPGRSHKGHTYQQMPVEIICKGQYAQLSVFNH